MIVIIYSKDYITNRSGKVNTFAALIFGNQKKGNTVKRMNNNDLCNTI
jgi:hypothetical protein